MFVLILVIFSLFWLFFFYNFYWKRRNLPPGPIPLPILGNIPQMSGKDRYQVYKDWANKYGWDKKKLGNILKMYQEQVQFTQFG
jgi:hypothetical protein